MLRGLSEMHSTYPEKHFGNFFESIMQFNFCSDFERNFFGMKNLEFFKLLSENIFFRILGF